MYFPLTIITTCCYFIQNGSKPVDSGPIDKLYYFCTPLTLFPRAHGDAGESYYSTHYVPEAK